MLEYLVICDSSGLPIYTRIFHQSKTFDEPSLLSDLISAIDSLGRSLFSKKTAVITYGEDNITSLEESVSKIIVISKDLPSEDKHVNFVFVSSGDISLKALGEIATTIYIEIKQLLRISHPDYKKIQLSTDKIIDNNFKGLINF